MKNSFIYEKVNSIIISNLESGVIPWKRSWSEGIPQNFISKKMYHGINFMLLSTTDFASSFFLTFLQCKEKEGSIKAGEKGLPIVFFKMMDYFERNKKDEIEMKSFPFLRYSTVFNLQQTTLYKDEEIEKTFFDAENIINNVPGLVLKNNFTGCYYSPKNDYISLPKENDFNCIDEYYSALFHELIHWTGHPNRLHRFETKKSDNESYSFEELVAEIGAAYLCNLANIKSDDIITNQTGYIQGWLKELKNDKKLIFKASAEAQRAVNFILNEEIKENEN